MNDGQLFFLNILLCVGAFAYHFMEKWAEYRRTTASVGFSVFIAQAPAVHTATTIATVLAFVGCYAMDWLNVPAALACGYMGDSVTRRLLEKFNI